MACCRTAHRIIIILYLSLTVISANQIVLNSVDSLRLESRIIDPKAYRKYIAQKTTENLTLTKPLRKAAKDAVDSSTPKDWNSSIVGSRGKGTDIDGDLDLIVRNKQAMTTREHKDYIKAIHLAFEKNIRNLGLRFDVKYIPKKRADTFLLINPVSKKVIFSVDVVWEFSTLELYIPFDYFRGKNYLQDAVRGVKMYFRRSGLPGMKGINCEMLVLFAHSLHPNSSDAVDLFLSVVFSLAELNSLNSYALFHKRVNTQVRSINVPERLIYEEPKIQSFADEARKLLSALRKHPVKTVDDMAALFS